MDAAECYALMVKGQIAPALRQLGWRGSGQTYRLPNPGGEHVLLGLQRSVWNTRRRVQFTINVSVIARADWEQLWAGTDAASSAPSANGSYGVGWQVRIGELVQPPGDHWWRVWGPQDVEPVAGEVLTLVQDVVQPQVHARLTGIEAPPAPAWTWTAPHWRDETALTALPADDEAKAWGGQPLPRPADLQSLQQALDVTWTRPQACRLLRLQGWDLDQSLDALDAAEQPTFLELFCIALLHHLVLRPSVWGQVQVVLGRWLENAPHLPADTTLVTSAQTAELLPYREALEVMNSSREVSLMPIVPVLCALLARLDPAGR